MKKKTDIIIWTIALCAVLFAAYTFYTKNKPQNIALQQPQKQVSANSSTDNKFQGDTSQQEAQSSSNTAEAQKIMAPDFSLKDLNSKNVKLSDYKGKIVILNFWAVWCKYCKQEMPDLNELNRELKNEGETVILAVDVQESSDTVKKYLTSSNIGLNVLLDQVGSVSQTYGVSGYPTTFIINKDGSVYTYIPGATNKETLLKIIDKAKKGEPIK